MRPIHSQKNSTRTLRYRLRAAFIGLSVLTLVAPAPGRADTDTQGALHAILVSGINQDPDQQRDKDQAIHRLNRYLTTEGGLSPQDIDILTSPDSLVADLGKPSTRENLLATLKSRVADAGPADRILFYYVGQANMINEQLRLNLPGPDLTHTELAEAFAPLQEAQLILILDCPGAGLAVKSLTGPGRILIAGARSDQPFATRLSSYLVPALGNPAGDFDGDGRTSLLESFQMAAEEIDALYRDQKLLKSETPILEDDNDAEPSQSPWRYATTGKDGGLAAKCFLVSNVPPVQTDTPETGTYPSTNSGGDTDEQENL